MNSKSRNRIIIAVVIVLIVASGVTAYVVSRPEPASRPLTAVEFRDELASENLDGLSPEARKRFLAKLGKRMSITDPKELGRMKGDEVLSKRIKALSKKELSELFGPMKKRGQKAVRVYFDKFFRKSREEQNRELDRKLDGMAEWDRRKRNDADAEGKDSPPAEGKRPTLDEEIAGMRRKLESTDPEDRAMFEEYIRRLRERARERGVGTPGLDKD
jgi:hypothetical protein